MQLKTRLSSRARGLPNALNPLIGIATIELANMMLFESGLSFLGLGVRPPAISWGSMLRDVLDPRTKGQASLMRASAPDLR